MPDENGAPQVFYVNLNSYSVSVSTEGGGVEVLEPGDVRVSPHYAQFVMDRFLTKVEGPLPSIPYNAPPPPLIPAPAPFAPMPVPVPVAPPVALAQGTTPSLSRPVVFVPLEVEISEPGVQLSVRKVH